MNEVNEGLGASQLVYSIPCMTIYADNIRLKKPRVSTHPRLLHFSGKQCLQFELLEEVNKNSPVLITKINKPTFLTLQGSKEIGVGQLG